MSNGLHGQGMNNSNGVRTHAELFDQELDIPVHENDYYNNNRYNVEGVHLGNQGVGCSGTSGPIRQMYDGIVDRSATLQQSIMRRQPFGGSGGASVSCVGLCLLLVCDICCVIFNFVIILFLMLLFGLSSVLICVV